MPSDIEIAQSVNMLPIEEVAAGLDIPPEQLEPYGRYKAKVNLNLLAAQEGRGEGKLVLVTAINPTAAGEGKTTTSVGLADALHRLGKRVCLALREPSLGPVFGVKGGAAGGGYAQVVPMEDINLHFTGDLHAITAANNLLAAMVDNHLHQGNALNLDPRRITWRRCLDMNDRQLRSIVSGLGGAADGFTRQDGFDITAASEIMAIFCLARDREDLKRRLSRIVVGYTMDKQPVTAGDLRAEGAMAALLKDALNPNLAQTLEHTPAFIHGGPFANIAHGCNSIIATRMALRLGDIAVTEAGFGADLGAEKFLDIKCRLGGLSPDAAVVVATVRALKLHGGANKRELDQEDVAALRRGVPNLLKHVENMREIYGLPTVVAINRFPTDTEVEIAALRAACREAGAEVALSDVWARGGAGGEELARLVLAALERPGAFRYAYSDELSVRDKIETIATRVYGAAAVEFSPQAKKQLQDIERLGFSSLPVCMAKTQYSLSDNPKLLGRPEGFTISIRSLRISAGAGFIVALTGEIMTMPGLPKAPAACQIDVAGDGTISGLF